jgi:hypothetical protein
VDYVPRGWGFRIGSKELQAFVHRYADDKDAFSAVIKLTRIQAAEVAAVIE